MAKTFTPKASRHSSACWPIELDDGYLGIVEDHLRQLAFPDGVLMSAELDNGNKGTHYVLRTLNTKASWAERLQNWVTERLFSDRSGYVYRVAHRDGSGLRALGELNNRGISLVASALAQSTDQIASFLNMLRLELGFTSAA